MAFVEFGLISTADFGICLVLSTRRASGKATLRQRRMGGHKDDDILKGVYLTLCSGLSETSQTLDTVSNLAAVDDPGVIISLPIVYLII